LLRSSGRIEQGIDLALDPERQVFACLFAEQTAASLRPKSHSMDRPVATPLVRALSHIALPSLLAALAVTSATSTASAQVSALRADLVPPKTIKLDGLPKEWPSGLAAFGKSLKGKTGKPDIEARGAITYDASNIYVAADVTDDTLRGGADHVALVIGFPGGTTPEIQLYPGDPGKTAGVAKLAGLAVPGAKVIEAPRSGGYTLEASIPWSALPQAQSIRVGLRAALFARDADGSSTIEGVVGTAASGAFAELPELATEPEQALADGLLREKGVRGAPRYSFIADVAGDSMKERVLIYDRYLVVLGPTFRKGSEYYWNDTGVDAANGMLPLFDVRDVTGDGQAELIFRKRFGSGGRFREMVQVLRFGASEVPNPIFQHEIGIQTEAGSVSNEVIFAPGGDKTAIKIATGAAKGFNAGNYKEATEKAFPGLLLPWRTTKSVTYKFAGNAFSKASEESQAATAAPAQKPSPGGSSGGGASATFKAPPAPSAAELMEKVYDLYKKDRGVSGKARFDAAVDVAGDSSVERVLLHGRDIVVFGKAFKGGTGYSTLSMMFASAGDIIGMTAKDLTGDGKAEIIVKGVVKANAPSEAGGGVVEREVVLVFQVNGDVIRRVFSAEIARSIGSKRIEGLFRLVDAGKSAEIELAPGKAIEWTEQTYPFNQDAGPVGGAEPLLLPWSGLKPSRYKWNGTAFVNK
jgi:hypothetical protein